MRVSEEVRRVASVPIVVLTAALVWLIVSVLREPEPEPIPGNA